MTPSEGCSSGHGAVSTGTQMNHLPLVSVTKADNASIQSTVDDMELKILERVSQLTISMDTVLPAEQQADISEVSFASEDLTDEADLVIASTGATLLASSPIRPRAKRSAMECLTTPIPSTDHTFETPQISNIRFGPLRKKRRPGSLRDAPRFPSSPSLTPVSFRYRHPTFSPFQPTIYDERLERLAAQMCHNSSREEDVPSLETSREASPIHFEPNFFSPSIQRTKRRTHRRTPTLPYLSLSPKQSHQLTPLESLAISIDASPIAEMPSLEF
jgi:hypothetical protein